MHPFEPLLELKPGQRPHPRHRDISLPRLTRCPNVQICGVERQALRLVNRHRPGQPEWELRETGGLRIVRIIPPRESLDRKHLSVRPDPYTVSLSASGGE